MRNEAIADSRDRFDKAGILRRVAQRFANAGDCSIDAVVKINKSLSRPKPFPDFLARDPATAPFNQHGQNIKSVARQVDLQAVLPQFADSTVHFEGTKAEYSPILKG
ncbi:MAG TPA: hypothetical protein VKM93_12400 [Terriglobia bacterium]|nr:hypothetical protein [Terriglobia bacterium]